MAGLLYNWHRYYDSGTGRYTQSDPVGLQGDVNTYAYALNQPTKYIDPSGLLVPLVIPGLCAAGGCEALIAAGIILMSPPGQGALKAAGEMCIPGDNDPCKGLRDQLRKHQDKLRGYMANPMSMDNRGFLADALTIGDQDLYNKIFATRIASLQRQIANFKKQLEECERRNGR